MSIKIFALLLVFTTLVACGGSASDASSDTEATTAGGAPSNDTTSDAAPGNEEPLGRLADDSGSNPNNSADSRDGLIVVSASPDAGAVNRSLASTLVINFDRTLLDGTVNSNSVFMTESGSNNQVDATIAYSPGEAEIVVSPRDLLKPLTSYTVTVNDNLMASDGTTLVDSWEFTTAPNLGSTSQIVMDSCMNQTDMDMLAAVNEVRVRGYPCRGVQQAATNPLRWSCQLKEAALGHSIDMVSNNFSSHIGSNGLRSSQRITAAGYQWRSAGENIAAGQSSIETVMGSWLSSDSGHCENIMSSSYVDFGQALTTRSDYNPSAIYRRYWTQNFAAPR